MTTFDRQAVIESLTRLVTPGIKFIALADELGARKHEYDKLRKIIDALVTEGVALQLPGGAFKLAPSGRAGDRKTAIKSAPEREEYDPPDEPFADLSPPTRPTRPLKTITKKDMKKESRKGAPPWGKGGNAAPPPAKAPRGPSGKTTYRGEYNPDTGEIEAPGPEPTPTTPPSFARASSPVASSRSPRPAGPPAQASTTAPGPAAPGAAAPGTDDRITGRITVHPAGYGFVALPGGETVFVPAKYRNTSLDGDRVAVETWPGHRGTEGRVTEVLARGRARLTGILRKVGRAVYLEPDDPRIAADYGRVHLDDAPSGKDGDAIVVEITRYPDLVRREMAAKLLKVLGDPDDPRTEIEKILACAVIPMEFPEEALQQAANTAQELGPSDLANRIDLRDRRFCSIDPETARDFDDALCIEDGPHGGPRVWVAVADVSHYVRWNDALDKESTIRGVSVYLPDRVIPMLPHQLSAGICSLNPFVDRCAMVVRLDYNDDAELVDVGYAAAVIQSKGRLDYPGVAAALGGDFRGRREMYRPWLTELERLNALARKLRAKRRARGALEIEIAEPKVILDADDARLVRDVIKSKGDPAVKGAYELVEEYMIAANEAVGSFFRKRAVPTVWRVHAPPKQERVNQLAELLGAYNIHVDTETATTPLGMKAVLDQINEKPGAASLGFLVLRTLTQAVWDTTPVGHFGLASGDYLHFTSPIRRYPDLLVHRLLKYYLHRDGQPAGEGYAKAPPGVETLGELAHNASSQERRAMEAEREAVSMYRAYLMRDQVGEDFEGTVSAVTSFGAFVELDEPFVEGLIKTDSLGAEPFVFDEIHMRLTGRKTGRAIALGDRVKVQINNVSVIRRRIDFTLLATARSNHDRPVLAPNPRVGLAKQKKAGREVDRAVRGKQRPEYARAAREEKPGRSAPAKASSSGGKLRLGVSHRAGGASRSGAASKPAGGKPTGGKPSGGKPGGKPAKKR